MLGPTHLPPTTRAGGVVDEHVEPPVLAADPCGGRRHARVTRAADHEEDSSEFVSCSPPALCITCPGEYGVASLEQPARRFAPKSLVRAGDQGNSHGPKYHRSCIYHPVPGNSFSCTHLIICVR